MVEGSETNHHGHQSYTKSSYDTSDDKSDDVGYSGLDGGTHAKNEGGHEESSSSSEVWDDRSTSVRS